MKQIFLIIFLAWSTLQVSAQNEDVKNGSFVLIKLDNGESIKGKVLNSDSEVLVIKSFIGEVTIKRDDIKKLSISKTELGLTEKEYSNFNDSYFLLPSARPVGKGNNHYKNYNLFYNQFNFGLSENFSLGTGFESFSFFQGEFSKVFFIAPKLSFGKDEHQFGLGTSAFFVIDGDGVGGLAFLNYTYGSANKNITLGASIAYSGDDSSNPAVFNVNMMYPVSKSVLFISEVIFGDFDDVLFDFGLRFMTQSGISFDVSILRPTGLGTDGIGIPLLGITVPFN